MKCNKYFDVLILTAPWAVVFDGVTAWSVNHLDVVPDMMNRIFHLFFLLFMNLSLIVSAMYMYDLIAELDKKKKSFFYMPGFISLLLIIAGINNLEFRLGVSTNYSMGFSVYVCFCSVLLYYGSIIFLIIIRHKYIQKDKKLGLSFCMTVSGSLLILQVIYPELLISSLCVMVMMLGFYVDFENPAIKKLTVHNEKMVEGFAAMIESRDNSTGGHIKRTKDYVKLILQKMKNDRHYEDVMSREYMTNVCNAAPLHDIGKIAAPDSVLQKPSVLTSEEYEIIKEHAACGGEIIKSSFRNLDNSEFLHIAYEVARYHHERYNGKGYPEGLVGEQIPLHARIMAIADVFDAVSQNRCYRDAMSLDECFAIIKNGIGTDFDPRLAEIFLNSRKEVELVLNGYK